MLLILSCFLYIDQGMRSCPGASCSLYTLPVDQVVFGHVISIKNTNVLLYFPLQCKY